VLLRLLQCSKRLGNIYWSYIRGFARDPSYNRFDSDSVPILNIWSAKAPLLDNYVASAKGSEKGATKQATLVFHGELHQEEVPHLKIKADEFTSQL